MGSKTISQQTKVGILIHVYHLEALGWEELVWGVEKEGRLGTLTTVADFLLNHPLGKMVDKIVMYSGPSSKDGLIEGAYAKQFLLDRLDKLGNFQQIRTALEGLSQSAKRSFERQLRSIVVGPVIKNTAEEVAEAARFFQRQGIQVIMQVASASHAPRCLKIQTVVRHQGAIPRGQRWSVVASEMCFQGTSPQDVVVIEPPHRGDDPMCGFEPSLAHLLTPYFSLSTEQKQALHRHLAQNLSTNPKPYQ